MTFVEFSLLRSNNIGIKYMLGIWATPLTEQTIAIEELE